MGNTRTITGVDNLFHNPEITLLYRDNSLYKAISNRIVRMLTELGFNVHQLILEGNLHAKKIRQAARSIINPKGGSSLVLPDHTCWRALSTDTGLGNLKYPFEHLDTLLSEAVIGSMFARTSIPPTLLNKDGLVDAHLEAITRLFLLIKEKGFTGNCHVIQNGLAEHAPFVINLVMALLAANAPDEFPPDRTKEKIRDVCTNVEQPLASKVTEAIAQAGIRTQLHLDQLLGPIDHDDIVICDLHYQKTHGELAGKAQILPLPLASLIAQACEHNLLPPSIMDQLVTDLEIILKQRYEQLLKRSDSALAQAK